MEIYDNSTITLFQQTKSTYLKVRNFRGKKISRISRICLEFAKLNSREKSDFT